MGYCSFGLQMSWENLEANSWILEESASVTALENFGVVVVTDSGRRPHCSSMAGGPRHKTYQSAWAVAGAESFREAVQSATSGIKGEDWRDGGSMLRTRPNNLFLLPYSMWSQASQNVSDLNVSEWSFLIRETRNGVFLLCCSLSSVCEWNPAARSATLQPLPKKSRAKSRTRRRRRWFWYVLITFFWSCCDAWHPGGAWHPGPSWTHRCRACRHETCGGGIGQPGADRGLTPVETLECFLLGWLGWLGWPFPKIWNHDEPWCYGTFLGWC